MRKAKSHAEHDNAERWLLTYADMITLLMAFFIMMYSMSVLNVGKFRAAAVSIRSGFGGMANGQGKAILMSNGSYSDKPSPISKDSPASTWEIVKPLMAYIEKDAQLRKSAKIGMDNRGVVVSMLGDKLMFNPGSAKINERAYPLLDRIAEMLDKVGNDIRVEGHTCDLAPSRGGKYPTNWELSSARATNVLRYFVEYKGLNAAQFSAAGFAGTHPILPNTCDANRRENRRVDIVILADSNEPIATSVENPMPKAKAKVESANDTFGSAATQKNYANQPWTGSADDLIWQFDQVPNIRLDYQRRNH